MAGHSANSVSYFLSLPLVHKEQLGAVRHWNNLKVGFDEETVWIKDLTPAQFDSVQIKTIPYKTLYYSAGPHLYLQGSLLPHRSTPSLLWTPIERGLPVSLTSFNHNYFGLAEKVDVRLKQTEAEKEAWACLANLSALQAYIESAPAVRLQRISWVMVDDDSALLLGTPLLPLSGETFWREENFLFPSGYTLEWTLLAEAIQKALNPGGDNWIVWNKEGNYWPLPKEVVKPLSIGSFRLSVKQ